MIETLEVRTSQGSLLAVPIDDVESGIYVKEIEGLDPVKATLVSSSFANLDGGQYQSSRRDERNIKLRLGLEPDYVTETVRSLRQRLYQYFMTKTEVDLRFYDSDGLVVGIVGRVESFDSAIFTDDPEVYISVMCFNPDFVELDSVIIEGDTVSTNTEMQVDYDGTVETGVQLTMNVDRPITEFTIYHRPPDGTLRSLEFAANLEAGDQLVISTVPGSKFVTLTRAGSDSSLLYAISPQSNWIEFQPGVNNIRVYAEGAAIPYQIEYTNKYGGL